MNTAPSLTPTLFYHRRNMSDVLRDMFDVTSAHTMTKSGLRIETLHEIAGDWSITITRSEEPVSDKDISDMRKIALHANIALGEHTRSSEHSVSWFIADDDILPRLF